MYCQVPVRLSSAPPPIRTRVLERARVLEVPIRAPRDAGLTAVATEIGGLGMGRESALVVADAGVATTGYVAAWVDALRTAGGVEVHLVPAHEPTVGSVDAAAAAVRTCRPGVVVAVGGGSALDTAKQAAAIATEPHSVSTYVLGRRPLPGGPPVVAVPTTAGTGAEVTRTCVVTAADGAKVWTWGDELRPQVVVLDAVATASLPAPITTAGGLDAFVHAIEAVTGRRAGDQVAEPAGEALRLVAGHLPAAVDDGADLAARQALQWAALLAGLAIDEGGTGIAHAIGHALGSLGHVPHGLAVAVGLAAALRWNVDGAPDAFAPAAATLAVDVDALPDRYAELLDAAALAEAVRRVGPIRVEPGGLAAAMADDANQPMLLNNCRLADDADRHALATLTVRAWDRLAR